MEYYGYGGKILYVDLTTRSVKTEPLDMDEAKKFIGAFGINQKLAYQILKPDTDPLSPDNPIIIGAGPLIGTVTPSAGKIQLTTKSTAPANVEGTKHFIGSATGGSNNFGLMLKNAGYDNVVITGQADKPCYLKIIDDDVEICDASDLWGNGDIYEVTDELTRRYGRSGVWAIGRAGENLVQFAHGITDKRNSFGRNGGATVAGSKKLKAIVVRGTKGVNVWDKNRLRHLYNETCKKTKEHTDYFEEALKYSWLIGAKWRQYYPIELVHNTLIQKRSCTGCPLTCRTVLQVKDGEHKGALMQTIQPMYLVYFGRRLELKDYREAMALSGIVNSLGLDYTTMMGMLKFVTRLYERGVITKEDTDGLELKMGDFHVYKRLLEKMANREGFGNIMADGWFALSKKFGVNAWEDMVDGDSISKGASTMFDGRFVALDPTRFVIAVNPKGGQHLHPITYVPGHTFEEVKDWWSKQSLSEEVMKRIFTDGDINTGRMTKHVEDQEALFYGLGVCTMAILHEAMTVGDLAEYYAAVTGIEMSPQELRTAGERMGALSKVLNVREGFTKEDDRVPRVWEMLIENPIKSKTVGDITLKDYFGKTVTKEGLQKIYDEYYDEHGWDTKLGIPTKKKLAELGLSEFAEAVPE